VSGDGYTYHWGSNSATGAIYISAIHSSGFSSTPGVMLSADPRVIALPEPEEGPLSWLARRIEEMREWTKAAA
jgi:hypothetical protein